MIIPLYILAMISSLFNCSYLILTIVYDKVMSTFGEELSTMAWHGSFWQLGRLPEICNYFIVTCHFHNPVYDSMPQTPQCVGAFSTGYALFMYDSMMWKHIYLSFPYCLKLSNRTGPIISYSDSKVMSCFLCSK
jgi:hypothetical protein